MATYQAIAATGQAILGLLADACPKPEFAAARFDLYQMKDYAAPMEEGISLYLYRLTANGSRRNLPPRTAPDGRRTRPPFPLDLHYLLTAWAKTAARQHRLLGWAIRALEDVPVLHASLLNSYSPEGEIFHPDESVEVIFEALSLADMSNMWFASKFSPQLSVTYVVRFVAVESDVELREYPPVQTRALDYGKVQE